MSTSTRTIFEALREDHDTHRTLMQRIDETQGDSPERRQLFFTLRRELESHAAAEERCFYAHLMQSPAAMHVSRHGVAEHHEVDELIADVAARAYGDPQWLISFRKLKDKVEHHMGDEEHGIFQLAGKVLSEGEKCRLGDGFATEKRRELDRRA